MSNNRYNHPALYNNNKSLYAPRNLVGHSSKKVSIIEDKTTFEPVRPSSSPSAPSLPNNAQNSFLTSSNHHRTVTTTPTIPPPVVAPLFEPSHLVKQIQAQKQALASLELEVMHDDISRQLEEWKQSMYKRVLSMKDRMLQENLQSYEQLASFQALIKKLLDETLLQQLLSMKNSVGPINTQELDQIEQQLGQMKDEIQIMKQLDLQLDSSQVEIVGELQLNKLTDFERHQPPPPPQPLPVVTEKVLPPPPPPPPPMSSPPETTGRDPVAPLWTDATRQGLNRLAHHLPFRLLIPKHVRQQLIGNFDIEQFGAMLQLSCQTSIDCILTILNQDDLDVSIDILTDLMVAFMCSPTQYELRLLFQNKFIPIITGKRNERLERFREKYQLDQIKIFPHTCPQSEERVVLLRCQHSDYIIYCLKEIFQNVLEQAHFNDDESSNQTYALYDPSVNYDESSVNEYGGYSTADSFAVIVNNNAAAAASSTDDIAETRQANVSSKHRLHSEEAPLNYDDTDDESDENNNDGLKRSKSNSQLDDRRIFVKELNNVKGRQVGLLIGPFGQHITQIREQTGAKIHLANDDSEPSVIKGTKSQINHALRLITECLQTQKPIPRTSYKGGRRR